MEQQRAASFHEAGRDGIRQTAYAKTSISGDRASFEIGIADRVITGDVGVQDLLPLVEGLEFSAESLAAALPERHSAFARAFRSYQDLADARQGQGSVPGDLPDLLRHVAELTAVGYERVLDSATPDARAALVLAASDLAKTLMRMLHSQGINLGEIIEKDLK